MKFRQVFAALWSLKITYTRITYTFGVQGRVLGIKHTQKIESAIPSLLFQIR